MTLWEFMKAVSDSFWSSGELCIEVLAVIVAWSILIGIGYVAYTCITCIAMFISFYMEDKKKERENGITE